MAYDAVINGANGILYWGLNYVPKGHPFLEDVARVARDVRDLTPAILGKNVEHAIQARPAAGAPLADSPSTSPIEFLVRERSDGRRVLFSANRSDQPARVALRNLPIRAPALRSRETGARLAITNGELALNYPPCEVRIFDESD